MPDSDRLRDRAARLLALALQAREGGKLFLSEEMIKLATEACDQADEMDRCDVRGRQVLISSHRKLLLSKATVVSVAETSG
jgi:hypothetical protein